LRIADFGLWIESKVKGIVVGFKRTFFCSFSLKENEPKESSVSIAPRETDWLCAKDSPLV
jgi:hypothetical protein